MKAGELFPLPTLSWGRTAEVDMERDFQSVSKGEAPALPRLMSHVPPCRRQAGWFSTWLRDRASCPFLPCPVGWQWV